MTDTPSTSEHREHIQQSGVVTETLAGKRCDQIAAILFPDFSRGKLQQWISSGELTVDQRQCQRKEKLYPGMVLNLNAEFTVSTSWQAEAGSLTVVYEDEHLLVIDKNANCVVHPAVGNRSGTLVNRVLAHCPNNAELPRGGIVHRLDKDTTGVMVVAKTLQAHNHLVQQLQARTVSRAYHAIVEGQLISGGTVDVVIGRHPKTRTKMAAFPNGNPQAKPAITHYRIAERFSHHTELKVNLETGRTHQIRVHMAHINHPLLGDRTYNPRHRRPAGVSDACNDALQKFPRQALHAAELKLIHPQSQELCEFTSSLPKDYQGIIEQLRDNEKSSE